jgi:acyl transferase domain-containing protein/NAD(P)-dependent dehydrogenase (short-subunit alcohol dehydrogenase family)
LRFGIAPRDLETIDSAQLLGLVVADAALTDAGYPADRSDHSRTAVVMGVTGGLEMLGHMSARLAFNQVKRALEANGLEPALVAKILASYGEQFAPWRESSFPGLLGNVVAGRIANRLNLGGANMVVDAACASSLAAVGQATLELRSGRSDLVVAGGMDTFTDPFMFTCFCKTPALSPSEETRPYDQRADGTVLGEGLGVLILKRLTDAQRDQDRIYAIIRGLGGSSDGKGTSIFAPSPKGQLRAMEAAYREAGFSPATVEMIEGHGTGTQAGDNAEVSALIELMGHQRPTGVNDSWCALGSVKSQIGHAKAAAGAAGLIKAILSLYHKVLPPSLKAKRPLTPLEAEDCPLYLNVEARPWLAQAQHPRRAAVSSFGFGGSNFHCLLEEGPVPKPLDEAGQFLIPLSGPHPGALLAKMDELTWADDPRELDAKVHPLYSQFRPDDPFRLVLTGDFVEIAEAWPEAKRLLSAIERGQYPNWPDGFHWSAQTQPFPLRLIVSPQDYQPNQGRALAIAFPAYQAALDLANELAPWPLGKILFPAKLAATQGSYPEAVTQSPYLGVISSLAQGALWSSLGLSPASVEGFGSGFLTAAYLAGALTIQDAFQLAQAYAQPSLAPELVAKIDWSTPRAPLFDEDQPIKDASDLRLALTKILGNPKTLFPEYHQDPRQTYLVIGARSRLMGRDVLKLADGQWSAQSLARIVASLASQGHRLALNMWATSPSSFPTPQGHYVTLTGANLFNAQKADKALKAPEPQVNCPVAEKALAQRDNLSDSSLKDLVALQAETLRALRELTQEMRLSRAPQPAGSFTGSPMAFPATIPSFTPSSISSSSQPTIQPTTQPATQLTSQATKSTAKTSLAPLTPESSPQSVWPMILEILSQETGYPAESLTESMDLEDDLGLDSIKRMELFAVLAERFPTLPMGQIQPRNLGELARFCQDPGLRSDQERSELTLSDAPTLAASAPTTTISATIPLTPPGASALDPQAILLEVLTQETGYPADSLKPDLDLESDLGLDSIKRVEILSTLSERLPNLNPATLAGATTVGELTTELAKGLATTPNPEPNLLAPSLSSNLAPSLAAASSSASSAEFSAQRAMELVAKETGYPVDLLTPNMELENDLGLDSIKRVEILSALAEKAPNLVVDQANLAAATTLGDWLAVFEPEPLIIAESIKAPAPMAKRGNGKGNGRALLDQALLSQSPPSLFQVEPETRLPESGPSPWPTEGLARLVGTDSLTKDLEKELKKRGYRVESRSWRYDFEKWRGSPADLLFLVWPGPDRGPQIITQALKALEVSGPSLKAVVGLSFLGGSFGFPRPSEGVALGNSISGALVGLLKCAAREWPEVATRALDLPLAVYEMPQPGWVSAIIENAAAPGPVELGLSAIDRLTGLALKPYSPEESPEPLLSPGDTVVVTGGGRGVTAAVLREMARLFRPRLVILGRTPLGPPEPEWLAALTTDQEIKASLHQASGARLTPRELGERARLILKSRELKKNLDSLAETGAQVEYLSGDFTRPAALEAVARRVRAKHGPIRGFIHGAGVLADHPILGKNQDDFARVYATKTQIAAHLLEAFQTEPLKLVVFFSSSTARFGRQGQSDYAAGNEVLNKTAWELSSLHPNTRVLAVNWGPWAGGMVNETLAGQFHAQGVGLIGLKEGAETFVRLIRSPVGDPAEVVVLGSGTNLAALTEYARGQNTRGQR